MQSTKSGEGIGRNFEACELPHCRLLRLRVLSYLLYILSLLMTTAPVFVHFLGALPRLQDLRHLARALIILRVPPRLRATSNISLAPELRSRNTRPTSARPRLQAGKQGKHTSTPFAREPLHSSAHHHHAWLQLLVRVSPSAHPGRAIAGGSSIFPSCIADRAWRLPLWQLDRNSRKEDRTWPLTSRGSIQRLLCLRLSHVVI